MPLPFYLHTDLCFYFPVLNVKRAYPPSSLNSCIWSSRPNSQAPRVVPFLRTLTCDSTSFPGLRDRTDRHQGYHPFYVHGPVILLPLLVFATELTGTKGKNYPFYVHRPVCLISTYTGTVTLDGTNRLGRHPRRNIEQRYIG